MSTATIALMIYASETDNHGKRKEGTLEQIVRVLSKRTARPQKKGGLAFSPGVIRKGLTRASENVEFVSMMVGDVDGGTTLEELRPQITQLKWIAYSSFSHDPAKGLHKFRIVFFLSRPCLPNEWVLVWSGFNALLNGHCDTACKDLSRLYYLPSCTEESLSDSFTEYNEGALIDPDELKTLAPSAVSFQGTNALAVIAPRLPPPPETFEEIERVNSMLAAITADCSYKEWRGVLWALAATGWLCAEKLARVWSEASTRFKEADFLRLWSDYDPTDPNATGFGSLVFIAKEHGWHAPADGHELAAGAPGDILAGRMFAAQYREQLLWVSQAGRWLRWDGMRWAWCTCGEEMAAAKIVADKILTRVSQLFTQDSDRNKRRMSFAIGLQNIRRLEAMIELAKSESGMAIGDMSALDSDQWLVGCRNGVVDLRTGSLLVPDPAMHITRQVAAEYHSDADCPLWKSFLLSVFEGDAPTVEFAQRALGYTLTGTVTEEVIFICYGGGANGKSVFANVLSVIFFEYGQMAPQSLLTVRRDGDAAPRNDVARLCGARLVQINELNSGDRLNEQIVKMLAGREMISARFLHKEHFDFWPTAKPWLRTNHRPVITGEDDGIWRRIMLIPFKRKFAEHERDPWLESKLLAERDGVFAWMVAGCLDWKKVGLKPSPLVRRESATYRTESDLLGEFLDETTERDPNGKIEQSRLFDLWRIWCTTNGTRYGSKVGFSRKLGERDIVEARSNGQRFYGGIKLRGAAAGRVGRV